MLSGTIRFCCGDLTFEEAYQKTGRILNITLSVTTKKAPPVLVNYIVSLKSILLFRFCDTIMKVSPSFGPNSLDCTMRHNCVGGRGECSSTRVYQTCPFTSEGS